MKSSVSDEVKEIYSIVDPRGLSGGDWESYKQKLGRVAEEYFAVNEADRSQYLQDLFFLRPFNMYIEGYLRTLKIYKDKIDELGSAVDRLGKLELNDYQLVDELQSIADESRVIRQSINNYYDELMSIAGHKITPDSFNRAVYIINNSVEELRGQAKDCFKKVYLAKPNVELAAVHSSTIDNKTIQDKNTVSVKATTSVKKDETVANEKKNTELQREMNELEETMKEVVSFAPSSIRNSWFDFARKNYNVLASKCTKEDYSKVLETYFEKAEDIVTKPSKITEEDLKTLGIYYGLTRIDKSQVGKNAVEENNAEKIIEMLENSTKKKNVQQK